MAWSSEQIRNAQVIASVGRQMGASGRDVLIGLMTAMQESGLRNLKYGDRDSQGLFQQRPSMGWGSVAQVTDPAYAARQFFSRLLADSNRGERSLTQAAQHVQRSGFPDAYAKHESAMRSLMGQLGEGAVGGGGGGGSQGQPQESPQGGPSITPKQNLDAMLAKMGMQEGAQQAPGIQGLTPRASNEVDLSTTLEVSDGGFEDLEGEEPPDDAPEEFRKLRLGQVGEGASAPENPLETQYITQNDEDFQGLDEFSTGTPWRGTEKDKEFVPLEGDEGWTGSDFSGGGGGAERAGQIASKFLGTPYKWGGATPLGFDCSGLISYVMNEMGISVPRASVDQSRGGQGVSMNDIKPGDLLFWDASSRNGSGADHAAIYIGNGQMIEANGPRGRVVKTAVRGGAWARRYG